MTTLARAINSGLHRALEADPKVLLTGEDIGRLGGVFRVTEGLQEAFGEDRVIDAPLAESGIVGTAIGLIMRGYRVVVEIQFDGFVYPAFDQIVTQAARLNYRTAGRQGVPMVIRIPFGGGIGAIEHHSESPEAYFCHTPGLKVVAPSNASDAHWMIQQAIASPDPVIFLEPKRRYHAAGGDIDDEAAAGLHDARIAKSGADATLIAWGPSVLTCLEAAKASEYDLEVLDLRSLSPVDWPSVYASVARTRRAIVVQEAPRTLGLGSELAARLHEDLFYDMEAPVLRVTGYDIPYPPARLEREYLPSVDRILDAVDRSLSA